MKYLGKKTDNLDIATQNDLGGGGGTSAEEIANRKRVDRYNIATYTFVKRTHTDNVIPTSNWQAVTQYKVYTNGDFTITDSSGVTNMRAYYASDGDLSTGATAVSLVIDFGKPYKISKFKVKTSNHTSYLDGSNDGGTYTTLYDGFRANTDLTEFTITNPDYYRYYRFRSSNASGTTAHLYEFQTSECEEFVENLLSIEDGGSTSYEEQERLLIQTPSDMPIVTNPSFSKNNLEEKIINGTLYPNKQYELLYVNGQYELNNSIVELLYDETAITNTNSAKYVNIDLTNASWSNYDKLNISIYIKHTVNPTDNIRFVGTGIYYWLHTISSSAVASTNGNGTSIAVTTNLTSSTIFGTIEINPKQHTYTMQVQSGGITALVSGYFTTLEQLSLYLKGNTNDTVTVKTSVVGIKI